MKDDNKKDLSFVYEKSALLFSFSDHKIKLAIFYETMIKMSKRQRLQPTNNTCRRLQQDSFCAASGWQETMTR